MESGDHSPIIAMANAISTTNWQPWHKYTLFGIPVAVIVAGLFLPAITGLYVIMALLVAFLVIAGRGSTGWWRGALIDDRNKLSLSRLQMMLWTVVILSGFLTGALANIALDVTNPLAIEVSRSLWVLMGISATAMVASPLIRSTKREVRPTPTQRELGVREVARFHGVSPDDLDTRGLEVVNRQPHGARWSDLVEGEEVGNGGHLDLGKVQNLFFTLVLVVGYVAALGAEFSALDSGTGLAALPRFDIGTIWLLGISHAGYLGFKAAPHSQRSGRGGPQVGPASDDIERRRAQGEVEHPQTEPTL